MSGNEHEALSTAANRALRAPSIFNSQPWLWRVDANSLELRADWDRMLVTTDPRGWLLRLSCGISLHHARVALAGAGWAVVVDRLPDPDDDDLLARIRLLERRAATEADQALSAAITTRRTDRRPFGDEPVTAPVVSRLEQAVEREGVHLHDVRVDQMPMLAVAVASAEAAETSDPAYRNELLRWINRPQWSNDGVPQDTGVAHVARRVPVRDFVVAPNTGMPVEPGGDRGARYLIVYGDGEAPLDWLRAGEGVSALLLTAVSLGLAVAPISDAIEVERPRQLVRGLLPTPGQPYLIVRCGHPADTTPIADVPRRDATETVWGSQP